MLAAPTPSIKTEIKVRPKTKFLRSPNQTIGRTTIRLADYVGKKYGVAARHVWKLTRKKC